MGSGIKPTSLFFLCNTCNTRIPKVELALLNNIIQLKITCQNCPEAQITLDNYLHTNIQQRREYNCTYPICESKQTPQKDMKYCVNCQYWICSSCLKLHHLEGDNKHHLFTENKVLLNCSMHPKNKLLFYWKEDNIFMCHQCISNAGEAFSFNQRLNQIITGIQNYNKEFQETMKRNANDMKDLESVLLKTKNKSLVNISKESFVNNKVNNDNLIELIERIIYTYDTFKQFPNSNIMRTGDEIKLNKTQMKEKITLENYDETYQQFCLYLQYNFIIQIKEINAINNNDSDYNLKQSSLIETEGVYDNNNQNHYQYYHEGNLIHSSNNYPLI